MGAPVYANWFQKKLYRKLRRISSMRPLSSERTKHQHSLANHAGIVHGSTRAGLGSSQFLKDGLMLRIKTDSVIWMTREGHRITLPREQLTHGLALGALLLMAGLALFGPSGLLAWGENLQLLEERKAQIAMLAEEREELRKNVDALHPERADPDKVGELLKKNLNVVRPDEVVLDLAPSGTPTR
jgi:cell division protein FtsB